MATYSTTPDIGNGLSKISALVSSSFTSNSFINTSATNAEIALGRAYGTLTGSFTFDGSGAMLSGTLDTLLIEFGTSGNFVMLSSLNLDVTDILAAMDAEAGGDKTAMEDLIYGLDWTATSTDDDDVVTTTTTAPDGTKIRFAGDDVIDLAGGDDQFFAHDGADRVDGGADNDNLEGGKGADTLIGGTGNDTLDGGKGGDQLSGGHGDDSVMGNYGRDKLYGGRGSDTLDGGDSRDRIEGGVGADILTGGSDSDSFVFDYDATGAILDTITDFELNIDRVIIDLDASDSVSYFSSSTGLAILFDDDAVFLVGITQTQFEADPNHLVIV